MGGGRKKEKGKKLQKEEWEECDAPRNKSEESNPSGYIDADRCPATKGKPFKFTLYKLYCLGLSHTNSISFLGR